MGVSIHGLNDGRSYDKGCSDGGCSNPDGNNSNNIYNDRTRTYVLDLIAGMCMLEGGHDKVIQAFEDFKKVCKQL